MANKDRNERSSKPDRPGDSKKIYGAKSKWVESTAPRADSSIVVEEKKAGIPRVPAELADVVIDDNLSP